MCLCSAKKKKRGARAVGADKSGRGLRQFSMKGDCENLAQSLCIVCSKFKA